MADLFSSAASGLNSPPSRAFDVTPHNTNELAVATRGIMVTGAGDVAVVTVEGDEVVLPGLQPGTQYAIRAKIIKATGTTATGIKGLA